MMTHPLSEQPDHGRAAEIQAKVDREFAGHDLRHAHVSLDILLAEMRSDADHLEGAGQYAGGMYLRRSADLIAEELGRVRAAEAVLNHTSGIQR